jgi:hypothetical protein
MLGISAVSPPISAQPASSQPLGDAFDHGGGGIHVEPAAGEVIEEEQRLGALHQDVIDAHRHQVLPDRVVAVPLEGQLELGADAVGARHQHRFAILFRNLEQRAEAADAGQHLRTHGALRRWLDAFHQRIPGIDIDAGIAVGERGRGWAGSSQDEVLGNAGRMKGNSVDWRRIGDNPSRKPQPMREFYRK